MTMTPRDGCVTHFIGLPIEFVLSPLLASLMLLVFCFDSFPSIGDSRAPLISIGRGGGRKVKEGKFLNGA